MQQFLNTLTQGTSNQAGLSFLAFSFGASTDETEQFSQILEGSLDNSDEPIVQDFKKNIQDIINKAKPLELLDKPEVTTDDQSQSDLNLFSLLNVIDENIKPVEQIKSISEFIGILKDANVSDEDIQATLDLITDKAAKASQETQVAPLLNKQVDKVIDTKNKPEPIISTSSDINIKSSSQDSITQENSQQPIIDTVKISSALQASETKQTSNIMAEQLLAGQPLKDPAKTSEKPFEQAVDADISDDLSAPIKNESQLNNNNKQLQEVLSLFKHTKEEITEKIDFVKKDIAKPAQPTTSVQANDTKATTESLSKDIDFNNIKSALSPTSEKATANQVANNSVIQEKESAKKNAITPKSEFSSLEQKFTKEENITPSDTFLPKKSNTNESLANLKATNINNLSVDQSNAQTNQSDEFINTIEATEEIASTEKVLASNFNQSLYKTAQQANIQQQISLAIRNLKDSSKQQIKIKMNPEELGNISIEMELSGNSAKAVISVERPEVAQHLAQNLKELQQNLKQNGLEFGENDFVVKLDDEKNQNNQQQFKQDNNQEQETEVMMTYNPESDSLVDFKV